MAMIISVTIAAAAITDATNTTVIISLSLSLITQYVTANCIHRVMLVICNSLACSEIWSL